MEEDQKFSSLQGARDTCSTKLTESITELEKLWLEVGIPSDQQITRLKVVYEHLAELMGAMVEQEVTMRDSYLETIVKCRDECDKLSMELETAYSQPDDNITVMKKEKHLRNQVKQLLKEKQERLREAMALRATEGELCARLGREPEYIPSDTVLSNEQIKEVNTRIGFLTADKNKREVKLAIAAKDILDLWIILNIKARTEREEIIESGCLDSFQLSKDNMEWLELMKNGLKIQLEENKKIHKDLMNKLQSLWNRMEFPASEQKLFLDQHTGYSDAVLVKIKEEVHKLEELKLQNLQKFIESTRTEIAKYWDMMFFAEEDKKLFVPFYSENIGEQLLETHEKKLEALIEEYQEYEELYKTVRIRNTMWCKWEEMECRENDPNRFANRGGNLLKEEKERKKLERELPKYEELIIKKIDEYEKAKNIVYTVLGHTFPDFINTQHEELRDRKEQMKENKQRQKEEEIQKELTYGSTPAKTPKRRIAGTQILTPASKRTKTGTMTTPARTPRTPRTKQFVHSSLITRSPIRTPTKPKEKGNPRVVLKVPTTPHQKRPDTPIKKHKKAAALLVVEPAAPERFSDNSDSLDSGIVNTFNDLDNNNNAVPSVGDYADFEKELILPSRELMRSSTVHTPSQRNVRKSLLNTIEETGTQ